MHGSDSSAQRETEELARAALSDQQGWDLRPETVPFDGFTVSIDGIDREKRVAVEIYSRIGKRSASRDHKVVSDAAKLHMVGKRLGSDFHLFIALCDPGFANYYGQASKKWQAKALQELGVHVVLVRLTDEQRQKILAAQAEQAIASAPARKGPAVP